MTNAKGARLKKFNNLYSRQTCVSLVFSRGMVFNMCKQYSRSATY